MADINPIARTNISNIYTRPVNASKADAQGQAAGTPRGDDAVQLSTHARLLSKLQELPEVRQELVDRVRGQIETGVYESPEKINTAVDGLLEDLA